MTERFTGRHMTVILIAFFAVVVAVNVTMARLAGTTFGGVVVENSYVASQHFNRWLDEAAREKAFGWAAGVHRIPGGRMVLALRGGGDRIVRVVATARHPLGRVPDRDLVFTPLEEGRFVSRQTLPPGRWRIRFTVEADGRTWRTEEDLF